MTALAALRDRLRRIWPTLDERTRRLVAANEATAWGAARPLHDGRPYVFVDESGVTTDRLRRYARSPRGARISDHTPCSHGQTHTVIAALRSTELTATAVFNGPVDTLTFGADRSPRLRRHAEILGDSPSSPGHAPHNWAVHIIASMPS